VAINWRYTVTAYHPALLAISVEHFLFPRDAHARVEILKAQGCRDVVVRQRRNNAHGHGSLNQAGLYQRQSVPYTRDHDRFRYRPLPQERR